MRAAFLIITLLFLTASSVNDARKANTAFERGEYTEAVQLYQQAIDQNPDDARLHFNLARALYELGDSDAAMESYERFKTLTDSPLNRSFADYNKGRMLTDMGNYDEALDFFREALINNPNDPDAKFNYELVVRKKQDQENEQESPESDDSDGDDGDSQSQDNQQDQDQDQNQDPDNRQQPGRPDQDDNESQQQQQPLEMTPEEAQNILDALEQLERELLENQKKESANPPARNERDW